MPTRKLPRERESSVQKTVRAALDLRGIVTYRRNVVLYPINGRYVRAGEKGQADLYGWERVTGRHWEIETKRPDERPTEDQLVWLKQCTADGAVAFWCDNARTAENVADAIQAGGRIVWHEDDYYDIEMP